MTSFPPIVILRGVRTLCEKAGNSLPTAVFSQNKRPPKRSSIVSLQSRIKKRNSVQRPMYSPDLLSNHHNGRMPWHRSCSKHPVLHSSVRQHLLLPPRTSRLYHCPSHIPANPSCPEQNCRGDKRLRQPLHSGHQE